MHTSMNQTMSLQQRMVLAPQIIQSIEILQLPIMALQERIDQELLENPALEIDQENPEQPAEEPPVSPPEERPKEAEGQGEVLEARIEDLGSDWGEYFSGRSGRGSGSFSEEDEDKKLAAMNNTPARSESLPEDLTKQLRLMDLAGDLRELCEEIINSLDSNGYLLYSLEELIGMNGDPADEPSMRARVEEALKVVQSLEPKGVACRNLQECLLLQIPPGKERELPRRLIEQHIEDLRLNRLPKIAKDTGRSIEEIKEAVSFIGTLNPRPGSEFARTELHYVVPDVVLEEVDNKYEVRLEDTYVPKLCVSPTYARMLQDKDSDEATKDFIRKKIQAARWLIESIEQRRSTVYKISTEIVHQQHEFLEKGIAYLHPLKMQEVADRAGVHVSTVSRAISDKYIQTQRGIFPIKYFFTGGIESDGGVQISTKSVQQELLEIIRMEDKKNPMSDEEIVEKLKEKGMNISRRTVTKYRKQLRIPSSRQRRQY